MAEVTTIARPYAEAAFSLADQSGSLAKWSALLGRMAQVSADPAVQSLLGNPKVTDAQLVELFMSIGGTDVVEGRSFAKTLAENGRLAALPQIHELFEQLKNEREGVVDADIASAFALGEADLAGIVPALEKRFKRKIQPHVRIDPELIGGVRITVGDEVIDSSIRGRLAAMQNSLTSN